jgi:uroporphyrinogen-III synthase
MSKRMPLKSSLQGRCIALAENRQLDILADLLERRGAGVLRVPLVTILDSPNEKTVLDWIESFIHEPPEYFIILTGEGLRRLIGFARRADCHEAFIAALEGVNKICRGPKPGRALKEIGLQCDISGHQPTTPGIIATLKELDLQGRRVAVQLYGEDPNQLLVDYLESQQARLSIVAPYIYAPKSDDERVLELIHRLYKREVDVIAFTSQPQFARLLAIAQSSQQEEKLFAGLSRTLVAAIGPVVLQQLKDYGIAVAISPHDSFFMKPMVREIESHLERLQQR